jgi:hypothetical protein
MELYYGRTNEAAGIGLLGACHWEAAGESGCLVLHPLLSRRMNLIQEMCSWERVVLFTRFRNHHS